MQNEHIPHHYGNITSLHGALLANIVYCLLGPCAIAEPYNKPKTNRAVAHWGTTQVASPPGFK